jgi:small subunit ribosomal protein S2
MEEKTSNNIVPQNVTIPEIKDFLKAGVQFGHETVRWNPKMKPYIYGVKNKIHIIDVQKTLPMLEEATKFLTEAAKRGPILFIATKRQARDIVQKYAVESGSYFVTYRWLGGLLTNFKMVKKSLSRFNEIEQEFEKGVVNRTKFEINQLKKEWERMNRIYKGVKTMDRFPSAVVVVDCHYEKGAVLEAKAVNIPIVSLVDTNSDPDLVDYVIPANDDALKSLDLILGVLSNAIKSGNGGRGVKHQFKDYTDQEIQIIKKETEVEEEEKVALSDSQKVEAPVKAKPRTSKKSVAQKGILELVKEEADKGQKPEKVGNNDKQKKVVTKKTTSKKVTKKVK